MPRTFLVFAIFTLAACDCASAQSGIRTDGGNGSDSEVANDSAARDSARGDAGGSEAICDNGLDDDDDGRVDEGCFCLPGDMQQCYRGDRSEAGIGQCVWGTQRCETDFEFSEWGECVGDGAPGERVCDGIDNNCDRIPDENCACRVNEIRDCYIGPADTLGVGICVNGFERCVDPGTGPAWEGCGGSILPEAEDCDGGDEDCDGRIDEDCSCTSGERRDCYGGAPGTEGRGLCASGRQECDGDAWGECSGDTIPVAEICDGGRDEDCDGDIDCDDDDCDCCTGFTETVPVIPAEAEVFFVVDRSGSMQWPAVGTSSSRWSELEDAMATVLPMISETPMGLLTFPEMNGTDERLFCGVAGGPDVNIGAGNASTIRSRLSTAAPRAGDTPTPDAIGTAEAYLGGRSTSRTPFVILATDGLPEPNCDATVPATVSALNGLRSREGIDTFVIGFVGPTRSGDTSGIPALRSALNQFADAGGRPRSGAQRYYEAVDGAALTSALRSILGAATECRFTFPSIPPAGAVVRQDSTPVPASGYTLRGRLLEFTGTYCTRIREGLVTSVNIRQDC
ncbi:MAG: hypothetical protein ACI9KE_003226 [Polyangiales bacterium]|jgi:hypothetical protein